MSVDYIMGVITGVGLFVIPQMIKVVIHLLKDGG